MSSDEASNAMNVKETGEVWDEGAENFCYTAVVLEIGRSYYLARFPGRATNFTAEEVNKLKETAKLVPPEHLWPPAEDGLTAAPNPLPRGCYIKQQRLVAYESMSEPFWPKDLLLKEARTCELLRASPHPNIAEYLGYVRDNGRMRGLCFAKYGKTLADWLKDGDRKLDAEEILNGIRSGIEHLHGLGLVHNDINPTNIMLRSDYTPVIIDFDSCEREGAVPECKQGTTGWDDGASDLAVRANDFLGLARLRDMLLGVDV